MTLLWGQPSGKYQEILPYSILQSCDVEQVTSPKNIVYFATVFNAIYIATRSIWFQSAVTG